MVVLKLLLDNINVQFNKRLDLKQQCNMSELLCFIRLCCTKQERRVFLIFCAHLVRSELMLGVNLSNNLSKYEVFSFQPIETLELRSMTSELKIQVPY